jgi:hypothetical protein
MNIKRIDFAAAAEQFCKERGLDRVAPCIEPAMVRGAELMAKAVELDLNIVRQQLERQHKATAPNHGGEKSGALQES